MKTFSFVTPSKLNAFDKTNYNTTVKAQLRGETGDEKKRILVVFVISTYNICFYYVGQIFNSEEQEKIYIIILLGVIKWLKPLNSAQYTF